MPTTQVGSHTVYYDEYGAGHPLLLLTGLGASRLGWWKQIEPLAKKYRVINMDNRDAGDSARGTSAYSIADMADDAAGLIQNLKLGRVFVMGISMGGFISQELALRHPALVEKLILVATSAGGAGYVRPAPEIAAVLMRVEGEDIETRVRRTYPLITGPGYMQEHPADLDQAIANAKAKPMSVEGYQRQLGACMVHSGVGVVERLARMNIPTLVIHGDHDPLIPYPNGKNLAAAIQGAKLSTYPGVGHLPPIEMTKRFNREVAEFFGA